MKITSYFSRILQQNSVRNRYLLIAALFVISVVSAAWITHVEVSTRSVNSLKNTRERDTFKEQLNSLEDKVNRIESALLFYLLSPEETLRFQMSELLSQARNDISHLSNNSITQKREHIKLQTVALIQLIQNLNAEIEHMMELRVNMEQLYPASKLMLENMLPSYVLFTTSVNLALANLTDAEDSSLTRELYSIFADARYVGSNLVGAFRMYIVSRFGAFGAPEKAMAAHEKNIDIYSEAVEKDISQLKMLNLANALSFEMVDSLENMEQAYNVWIEAFYKVKALYQSPNWRGDLPLLEWKIKPIFHSIESHLQGMDEDLVTFANEDFEDLSSVSDMLSTAIWLLAIIATIGAIFSYFMFEYSIYRPLTQVVQAIKAETLGEKQTALPEAKAVETRALIESFAEMRKRVHNRQRRLEAILDNAAEAIIILDQRGIIESFNTAAEALFAYSVKEIIGKNIKILVPQGISHQHEHYIEQDLQTNVSKFIDGEREVEAISKTGELISVSLKISETDLQGKKIFTAIISDIRERKHILEQLKTREQRLKTILDNVAEGILTFDEFGYIHSFNSAAENLFGYFENEIIDKELSLLIPPQSHDAREGYLEHLMHTRIQQWIGHEGELWGRHNDGSQFPIALKVSKTTLEGKSLYTGLVSDISERKAMLEHLKKMAEQDGLTGLYNRSYFQQELERVVERVDRNKLSNHAVLYIDLDNFKYINDTMGHAAGDQMLIEVSNILLKRSRKGELIARFGGDEFTVLLFDTTIELAASIAESFRQHLVDYWFRYDSKEVDIGCSIGVAPIFPNKKTAEEILSQADLACNLAKRLGRNRVYVFKPEDQNNVDTMTLDMGWFRRIKVALERGYFVLACQPIVNTRSREITCYEVLIRMLGDNGEIIMPAGFMPSAERFGLAVQIDHWVISNAIETLAKLREKSNHLRYAINLSGQTLSDPSICDLIHTKLEQTGLAPEALTFEVTETVAIAEMSAATKFLNSLQQLGCKTALDDFGSGMCSFAYLQDLPVDIVKIDGRFVKNIADNLIDQAILKAMNDIAHALNKQTVAEFVQNEKSMQLLTEFGVDFGQGYYLGRPEMILPFQNEQPQDNDLRKIS